MFEFILVELRVHELMEWVNYVEHKQMTYTSVEPLYRRVGWSRGKVYISAANESVP